MANPRTDALKRSLQLSINDPQPSYQYGPEESFVEISPPPSPVSSTRASIATSTMSWPTVTDDGASVVSAAWTLAAPNGTGGQDEAARLCTVRCLYDFASEDPDHLAFRAGELLDVVRQEDTGWWAAVRRDGDHVGWIPSAFVLPVSDADLPLPSTYAPSSIAATRDDTSVWGPEDFEDGSIPTFSARSVRTSEWSQSDDESDPILDSISPGVVDKRRESFLPPYEPEPPTYVPASPSYTMPTPDLRPTYEQYPMTPSSQHYPLTRSSDHYPPTPETPIPVAIPSPLDPSPHYAHRAPPPTSSSGSGSTSGSTWGSTSARGSLAPSFMSSIREHPLPLVPGPAPSSASIAGSSTEGSVASSGSRAPRQASSHHGSEIRVNTANLAARVYAHSGGGADDDSGSEAPSSSSAMLRSPQYHRIRQLAGNESAERVASQRGSQSSLQLQLPWYLRTAYAEDELKMEADGVVKMGTLPALVERLTAEPVNLQSAQVFRTIFLTTFRTFAKAEEVFRLLVDQYEMGHPPNLSDEEFDDWKARKLRPTQRRALQVMDEWLEHHNMLQEEPPVARQLQIFLGLVKTPQEMVQIAQTSLKTLERLTFDPPLPPDPPTATSKKKKFKLHKNELIKTDPMVLAQHITMLEWRLYARVTEQQCLNWANTQSGPSVEQVVAFCATHDQIGAWVKHSVLSNDSLGKRADMVDYWIKVAEKCRTLNNFSATTAIVAGLAATVISKLALTWAHVCRASHLEPLVRLNEPAGHFGAYRAALAAAEGPCIPFIGGFLSDIVHVADQLEDPPVQPGRPRVVHFGKRRRWADAVRGIVRHQVHPYALPEDAHTVGFVQRQIADAVSRDPAYFWSRSQELQGAELEHADIRKGLEAAGF